MANTDVPGDVMKIFWTLASKNEEERIGAVKTLIIRLLELQSTETVSETLQNTPADGISPQASAPLKYTLTRLVKGLQSNRDAARQGFALALLEVLKSFPYITLSSIFKLIQTQLTPGVGNAKSERKDMHFGKVFGILTIIKSDRLDAKNGSVSKEEDTLKYKLLTTLISLSTKKSYLTDLCYETLSILLPHLPPDTDFVSLFPTELSALTIEDWSPSFFTFAVQIQKQFPKHSSSIPILHSQLFQPSNFSSILTILKLAHPHQHIWALLFDYVKKTIDSPETVQKTSKQKKKAKPVDFDEKYRVLKALWDVVAEGGFYSENVKSPKQKFLGLVMFENCLKLLDQDNVHLLATPNFLNFLFERFFKPASSNSKHNSEKFNMESDENSSKFPKAKENLLELMKNMFEIRIPGMISNKFAGDDEKAFLYTSNLLLALLFGANKTSKKNKVFVENEKRKKSNKLNFVNVWIEKFIKEKITTFTKRLMDVVETTDNIERYASVVDLLEVLVKSNQNEKWLLWCMKFCFVNGVLVDTNLQGKNKKNENLWIEKLDNSISLPIKMNPACVGNEKGGLAKVITTNLKRMYFSLLKNGLHYQKEGKMKDGWTFVRRMVEYVCQLEKNGVKVVPDENKQELIESVKNIATDIEEKGKKGKLSKEEKDILLSFELLAMNFVMKVVFDKEGDSDLNEELVGELFVVYQKMNEGDKKKNKNKSKTEDDEEEEPSWKAVLVDICLGLLSVESVFMRAVVSRVFGAFCVGMEDSVLDSLVDIIISPPKSQSQADEDEDEDEDGMDIDEEEEEEEEEEQKKDKKSKQQKGKAQNKKNKKTDEDEEDEEEDDGLSFSDISGQVVEVPNATDEEMFAMDAVLANVFKEMAKRNATSIASKYFQLSSKNFRLKAVDLVEIFVKKNPGDFRNFKILKKLNDLLGGKEKLEASLKNKIVAMVFNGYGKVEKKYLDAEKKTGSRDRKDEILFLKDMLEGLMTSNMAQLTDAKMAKFQIFLVVKILKFMFNVMKSEKSKKDDEENDGRFDLGKAIIDLMGKSYEILLKRIIQNETGIIKLLKEISFNCPAVLFSNDEENGEEKQESFMIDNILICAEKILKVIGDLTDWKKDLVIVYVSDLIKVLEKKKKNKSKENQNEKIMKKKIVSIIDRIINGKQKQTENNNSMKTDFSDLNSKPNENKNNNNTNKFLVNGARFGNIVGLMKSLLSLGGVKGKNKKQIVDKLVEVWKGMTGKSQFALGNMRGMLTAWGVDAAEVEQLLKKNVVEKATPPQKKRKREENEEEVKPSAGKKVNVKRRPSIDGKRKRSDGAENGNKQKGQGNAKKQKVQGNAQSGKKTPAGRGKNQSAPQKPQETAKKPQETAKKPNIQGNAQGGTKRPAGRGRGRGAPRK